MKRSTFLTSLIGLPLALKSLAIEQPEELTGWKINSDGQPYFYEDGIASQNFGIDPGTGWHIDSSGNLIIHFENGAKIDRNAIITPYQNAPGEIVRLKNKNGTLIAERTTMPAEDIKTGTITDKDINRVDL